MLPDPREIYLSRLILNPGSRDARRDWSDCQSLHCTILEAFPPANKEYKAKAREQFGLLYRLDSDQRKSRAVLLVQSFIEPDWRSLPAGYLSAVRAGENPSCKQIGAVYEALQLSTTLRFRLRANPTRKIETKSGADGLRRNGKRVEIRDEDGQLKWLARKGEQHGFRLLAVRAFPDVPNVRAIYEDKIMGRRQQRNADTNTAPTARLTFGSVLFDGELSVTDVELFRQALMKGVGTGKAYGFGLLSIAPVAR